MPSFLCSGGRVLAWDTRRAAAAVGPAITDIIKSVAGKALRDNGAPVPQLAISGVLRGQLKARATAGRVEHGLDARLWSWSTESCCQCAFRASSQFPPAPPACSFCAAAAAGGGGSRHCSAAVCPRVALREWILAAGVRQQVTPWGWSEIMHAALQACTAACCCSCHQPSSGCSACCPLQTSPPDWAADYITAPRLSTATLLLHLLLPLLSTMLWVRGRRRFVDIKTVVPRLAGCPTRCDVSPAC